MSKLDEMIIKKAINALIKYEDKSNKNSAPQLWDQTNKTTLLVQISLLHAAQRGIKPVRVILPHPLISNLQQEEYSICFFCRSEDKEMLEKYISSHPIPGFSTIISINQLKKYYFDYKDKKELLKQHTNFICDARIFRQLINLLGNVFLGGNHIPIPIDITNETSSLNRLPGLVQKVITSSYMRLKGLTVSFNVGLSNMPIESIAENVMLGINHATGKFKDGWKDVRNIHLKTITSAALPIYSKSPDELTTYFVSQVRSITSDPVPMKISDDPAAIISKKVSKKSDRKRVASHDDASPTDSEKMDETKTKKKLKKLGLKLTDSISTAAFRLKERLTKPKNSKLRKVKS